jgi:hypothetical protein
MYALCEYRRKLKNTKQEKKDNSYPLYGFSTRKFHDFFPVILKQ